MRSLQEGTGECAECLEGGFGTDLEKGDGLGKCNLKNGDIRV